MVITSYFQSKKSYVWDADFLAFWARTSGTPDSWKIPYNQLFLDLKAANLYNKADVVQMYAGHNATDSLLNLISASHTATPHNLPAFTSKQGYKGNGINAYLNSHYNPSTDGTNWQLNDAGIYVYIHDTNTLGNKYHSGAYSTGGNATFIASDASSAEALNGAFTSLGIPSDVIGLKGNSRLSASTVRSYWNGSFYNLSSASNTVTPFDIYCFTLNENGAPGNFYTNAKESLLFCGAALSDTEVQSLETICQNWLLTISTL